jgi:hypothetical protein
MLKGQHHHREPICRVCAGVIGWECKIVTTFLLQNVLCLFGGATLRQGCIADPRAILKLRVISYRNKQESTRKTFLRSCSLCSFVELPNSH